MRLVIVGHARSGTTILQNALNTSRDVYLLGEANLYREGQAPDFRSRYNGMHRRFGNQPTKSTYALSLDCEDNASGQAYLEALSSRYAVCGEKLALGHPSLGNDFEAAKRWIERNDVRCLFVLRDPLETIESSAKMFADVNPLLHVSSYAQVLKLYLDLVRSIPDVRLLIHRDVRLETFDELSRIYSVELDSAWLCYRHQDAGHVRSDWLTGDALETLQEAFRFIRQITANAEFRPGQALMQVEAKLSATPSLQYDVGRCYRELSALIEEVDAQLETPGEPVSQPI